MELRVAVVDDEREQLDLVASHLERFAAQEHRALRVSAFRNGFDLLAGAEDGFAGRYDLILLDIQMGDMDLPDSNGISVARAIRQCDADVRLIFVTNLGQYAIQGYSVRAMDFIVKPLTYEALREKLLTVCRELDAAEPAMLCVRNADGLLRIPQSQITCVEIVHRKLVIHTLAGDHGVYDSLQSVGAALDPARFFRCHSSALVNLAHIQRVGKESAALAGGAEVPVSRRHHAELLARLTDELGNRR